MIAKLLKLISWSLLFVLLSCLDSTGRYRSVPVKPLTIKEIKADFNSLIANIESNYAPLALEEKFKNQGGYDIVKKKFYREVIQITQLPEDQRLEEFTRLVTRFFAQFQDAHMSVSFFPTAFPGLSKMQYLGVLGGRQGNDYLVTQIHPLILNADKFPIRPGDVITHIEHVGPGGHKMMTLTDYIDQYITKYRNLGNKESNYTFLMDSIFHRNSLSDLPPNTEYVKLRVLRSGMENNAEVVKLKWTEQDYANFEYDLKNLKNNQYVVNVKFKDKSGKVLKEFPVAYKDRAGNPVNLYEYYLNFFDANPNHYERFNGTFAFRDLDLLSMTTEAGLLDKLLKRKKSEGMERLHQQRNVPKNVEWIKGSDVFPAYIETIEVDGKKTKVGYWRIDTFSPEAGDDEIMKQVASTLEQFKKKGVKKIVVDALDNGGAIESRLTKLTQMMSPKPIEHLDMRFKLNDNWLSDLYYMAQQAEGDEKKLYMKMHTEMMNEYKAGKRMSHTYSLETIVTEVKPNPEAVGFEFVFLANEGVASSGDIFMANVRNNQLGVIIGQRTMGAGGNVVGYSPLDFSHGYFRMTESLLYNKKIHGGKPIENLGVEPHLYVDTNINRANNFSEIIKVAQHFITDHGEYSSAMAHVQAFKAGLCNLFLRRSLH